jgi:hypothetical protein
VATSKPANRELSQDIDPDEGLPSVNVSDVLSEEKKQQVIALGRLGWSLRRIQETMRIRRETASRYLKEAGVAVRQPGGWGRNPATAAKPAIEVATDLGAEKPPDFPAPNTEPQPGRSRSSSACEPHREVIELGLSLKCGPRSWRTKTAAAS